MHPNLPLAIPFQALKHRLALKHYEAIGIIEALLQFATRSAPQGEIGRFSNLQIAWALEWPGDPDDLILALEQTGWLISDANCRFRIPQGTGLHPPKPRQPRTPPPPSPGDGVLEDLPDELIAELAIPFVVKHASEKLAALFAPSKPSGPASPSGPTSRAGPGCRIGRPGRPWHNRSKRRRSCRRTSPGYAAPVEFKAIQPRAPSVAARSGTLPLDV